MTLPPAPHANSEFSLTPKSVAIPKEIIELTIDSLSYNGGRGVGRYDGVVVFVPQTAPGDTIRAVVTSKRKRFWEAELEQVLTPGSSRRDPPCPVTSRCGGCSWQHVTYAEQVVQKQKILNASLRPLAKFGTWEEQPFLKAPDEFHYRNRIQVQIRGGKKGFFAKRTNDLVETNECWIAEPDLNVQLKNLKTDEPRVELRVREGGDFAQVNDAQNIILKARVLATVKNPEWLMDLYSGSGNITRPLHEKFFGVPLTSVEFSETAVAVGRTNLPSVEWHSGDVAKVLAKLQPRKGRGVIVLDPPRNGCEPEAITQVLRHAPKQIVYVSCNPTTFSRDATLLVAQGYKVEFVQGLDMFPQTEHVELIASLCAAT